jgi:hypothetical protein
LAELEKQAMAAPWKNIVVGDCDHKRTLVAIGTARGYTSKDIPDPDASLICDLRNAAPAMLAVLGKFQPGDSERLEDIIETINFSIPSELQCVEEGDEELDFAYTEYQELVKGKGCLRRLQEACQLMEAEPSPRE